MRFHIKRDKSGVASGPGECRAKTAGSCPNGGFHSEDSIQVQKAVEVELSNSYGAISQITKPSRTNTPKNVADVKENSIERNAVANKKKIVIKRGSHKKAMPNGVLAPAKIDENGNELRPASSYEDYYAGTNKKHFMNKAKFMESAENKKQFLSQPGSQFDPMKVSSLEELVDVTSSLRKGGLKGDDREELIKRGADPAAFNDNFRYLITPVGGHLGAMTSDNLSDDTPVGFYEKTPGSNIVSITIDQPAKPKVNYGVLIMGSRNAISPTNPGDNEDDSVVVTAHPGLPSRVNQGRAKLNREAKADYDEAEHNKLKKLQEENRLTVGEVRKMKGNRDFNLNVKLA